jgi:hypothetical protein
MSVNFINQVAYLRTSREFPEELHQLTVEINKTYVDIANAVNDRTIGIFPTNRPAQTGEAWFITSTRQNTFRQLYVFTSTAAITHNIPVTQVNRFTRCFGEYTDGTNWYGLINGTSVAIAGQILFYVTPTQIVFVVGAGAPALTRGNIVLEWLSQV